MSGHHRVGAVEVIDQTVGLGSQDPWPMSVPVPGAPSDLGALSLTSDAEEGLRRHLAALVLEHSPSRAW